MNSARNDSSLAISYLALLGASNLTFALPTALKEARSRLPGQVVEVHVAHGPGRSYGMDAGIGFLRFRALSECDLFDGLREAIATEPGNVSALLTDIGNDIGYGASAEDILVWVRRTIRSLRELGAGSIAITSLPVESLKRLPAWKFQIVRRVLFPFRAIRQSEIMNRVAELQAGLESLAVEQGFQLLETSADRYGIDHIHLRGSRRNETFSSWLDALLGPRQIDPEHVSRRISWIRHQNSMHRDSIPGGRAPSRRVSRVGTGDALRVLAY